MRPGTGFPGGRPTSKIGDMDLGEKIGWWAMDLGRFFDRSKIEEKDIGLNLQTGNGNMEMEDIED